MDDKKCGKCNENYALGLDGTCITRGTYDSNCVTLYEKEPICSMCNPGFYFGIDDVCVEFE